MKRIAISYITGLILLSALIYHKSFREIYDIPKQFTLLLSNIVYHTLLFLHIPVEKKGLFLEQAHSILEIKDACNALILVILYIAAILAFPGSWKRKLLWSTGGVVIVESVNLFRIVFLSFVIEKWPERFEFFHYVVSQSVLILSVMLLFYLYLKQNRTCQ